jgi:SAM-dependent methyltransferase
MPKPLHAAHASAGSTFDSYAEGYKEALERGVGLSGEDSSFFAQRRVEWVGRRLNELGLHPHSILDFGCGIGSTTPYLLGLPGATRLLGVDVSGALLDVARREYGSERVEFGLVDDPADSRIDLAYCNGVFHHIPPPERRAALHYVWRSLRPGGLFAFWENNPWNPGSRLVMRRIPFDRAAVRLSAPEARRLLESMGFRILATDFLFVFPRALAALRRLEPPLSRFPLGAQYLMLGTKPEAA